MTKRNYYAEAIEILARPHDAGALLIAIAKVNPSIVVRANETLECDPLDSLVDRILPTCRGKIDAIKQVRGCTALGLKEAKDAVEARMAATGFEFV